jgi:hypothetical protein
MAIWLNDLVEQIATSMILAESGTDTNKRLSLIIVDNAFEFLMVAYVELEAQLVGKTITNKDWEQRKRDFEQVLDFVYSQFNITASKTDILAYHKLRNKLYHDGKPFSINEEKISEYATLLKTMLFDLQKYKLDDDHWRKIAHNLFKKIAQKEAQTKIVITYSNENGQTRFITDATMKDTEAIMHTINAYSHYFSGEPSFVEVEGILIRSHHALEKSVISKRLDHLRTEKKMLKTKRLLDPKAVETLRKKFAIIPT